MCADYCRSVWHFRERPTVLGQSSLEHRSRHHNRSLQSVPMQAQHITANPNLSTVIALPVSIVARVKVSTKQRFGLYAVLSLGLFVIGVAIARVIVTDTQGVHPEISWLALWSVVESSVAVLICCLASFKAMFTAQNPGTDFRTYHAHAYGTDRDPREAVSSHRGEAITLSPVETRRRGAVRDSWDCDSSSQVEILSATVDMGIHKPERVRQS
jgi:hypothetical protein